MGACIVGVVFVASGILAAALAISAAIDDMGE